MTNIASLRFDHGNLITKDDGGRETSYPYFIKLAQVVMAMLRIMVEKDMLDDILLYDDSGNPIEFQNLLDVLQDYYGAEYENENKVI